MVVKESRLPARAASLNVSTVHGLSGWRTGIWWNRAVPAGELSKDRK